MTEGKGRVMRTAETILTVIQARGSEGLPLERIYRLLFNKDLYLRAYARLYPNRGAMTKGSTEETVDGMAVAKIDKLIDDLRHERFRWTPVRRVLIPKRNGKRRPLGLPTWTDKLVQEVLRSILEAYFEPQFCQSSHGFRPARGCHTALTEIQRTWKGTRWYIEGDIAQYFDTINHDVLMRTLSERIHDGRFLRLIRELLTAGYLDDWQHHRTLSGTPQGGVLSPLLSNIYLHQFDQWVETVLIPAHTRGDRRKANPAYIEATSRIAQFRRAGQHAAASALSKERRALPSTDTSDPDYRRLHYVRYADDFLLGFAGPKAEAEAIKGDIKDWLQGNLSLSLSEEKTLVTHATTEMARFLGYDIANGHRDHQLTNKRRTINGVVTLRIPATVVDAKCARYMREGKPIHRTELLKESDYAIIQQYQQEYRGVVQYYLLAHNVAWLNKLHWVMKGSLLKTLAAKHQLSVMQARQRYAAKIQSQTGRHLAGLEVRVEREGKKPLIAQFGGISLTRQPRAALNDQPFEYKGGHSELLRRLEADTCELCGSQEHIEVHHIRKLVDLYKKGRKAPVPWVVRMAKIKRKTLVVCRACHRAIHAGRPTKRDASE